MRIPSHHTKTGAVQWEKGCAGPEGPQGLVRKTQDSSGRGLGRPVTKHVGLESHLGLSWPCHMLAMGPSESHHILSASTSSAGNSSTFLRGQLSQEINVEFLPWSLAHSKCSIKEVISELWTANFALTGLKAVLKGRIAKLSTMSE